MVQVVCPYDKPPKGFPDQNCHMAWWHIRGRFGPASTSSGARKKGLSWSGEWHVKVAKWLHRMLCVLPNQDLTGTSMSLLAAHLAKRSLSFRATARGSSTSNIVDL